MTESSPAVAVAVRFVDQINRRDLDGLRGLLTADHRLEVFDEEPLVGRDANTDAWRGYFEAFPHYVIYTDRLAERDGTVAIPGCPMTRSASSTSSGSLTSTTVRSPAGG
jgi:hypothetical protein